MILWGSRFDYSQKIRSWNVQHSSNYDQFYNVNPPKPFFELRNERLSQAGFTSQVALRPAPFRTIVNNGAPKGK